MAIVRGFACAMSEVISFRLNKDNLRESKALLILQEWKAKGYSILQTLTEALLKLEQNYAPIKPCGILSRWGVSIENICRTGIL